MVRRFRLPNWPIALIAWSVMGGLSTPHGMAQESDSSIIGNSALPSQPDNALDYLEVLGLPKSDFKQFSDHQTISETSGDVEFATIQKILMRLRRLPDRYWAAWAINEIETLEMRESSVPIRGAVVHLSGRATHIRAILLSEKESVQYEATRIFVVTIQPKDSKFVFDVFIREVPKSWETLDSIDEAVQLRGIVLKFQQNDDRSRTVIFAAKHLEWLPDRSNTTLGVAAEHVALAKLGMDIALVERLPLWQNQPLNVAESDGFYSLLECTRRIRNEPKGNAADEKSSHVSIGELLKSPNSHRLRLIRIDGTVRRITKVLVDSPDLRFRLGQDHYYQVDLFMELNKLTVTLESPNARDPGPIVSNSYPATICLNELPGGVSEGDRLQLPIEMNAVFYRMWSFPTALLSSRDSTRQQTCPLLMAHTFRIKQTDVHTPPIVGWFMLGILVFSVLGVWFSWRHSTK